MNTLHATNLTKKSVIALGAFAMALSVLSLPLFASAATYAYVDTTGEVKPVLADTWQQAIAKAVGIHMHSGVMLLDSPSDFDIVGNEVDTY